MANIVQLDKSKGIPEIEVFTGQIQIGKYQLQLWNSKGEILVWDRTGINTDDIPDIYPIGEGAISNVKDLDNMILDWDVRIASTTAGPGETYFTSIEIRQNGHQVPNGLFTKSGSMSEDHVRFSGTVILKVV